VSQEGEGFFRLAQAHFARSSCAKRFCLIHDWEARFSVSWLAGKLGLARSCVLRLRQRRRTQGKGREDASDTA